MKMIPWGDVLHAGDAQSGVMRENTPQPVRILIGDRDAARVDALRFAFESEGWEVEVASTESVAYASALERTYNIIVVDEQLSLSRGSKAIAQLLRSSGANAPIMLLGDFTALRSNRRDELGHIDYLDRAMASHELVFAVQAVVQRLGLAEGGRRVGDLTVDDLTARVWRDDQPVVLSPLAFEMLRVLADDPGTPLSVGGILRKVAVRGVRMPWAVAERLLATLGSTLNAGGRQLLQLAPNGNWSLAVAPL